MESSKIPSYTVSEENSFQWDDTNCDILNLVYLFLMSFTCTSVFNVLHEVIDDADFQMTVS